MNKTKFDLKQLLTVVFHPKEEERLGIFIDLENPKDISNFAYLTKYPEGTPQRIAHDVFYSGLIGENAVIRFESVEMFAYKPTGGSNLDLPATVVNQEGKELRLEDDVLSRLDIVIYLSDYSATAPITAMAKKMGFRGATMHSCNPIVLETGLAQNYDEVSEKAERYRLAVTRADKVTFDFEVLGKRPSLTIELSKQEAQKSHGLCRKPYDIANLPAGEIYWVPTSAHGEFPMKFDDGTIALMSVRDGRIHNAKLLQGNQTVVDALLEKIKNDPATGELGELGLGTQVLPFAGVDIQDEKVLGTFHIATGRSDHLGGSLTPDKFKIKKNATHDDILFAPHKTPEIHVPGVWLHKDGKKELLIEEYQPTAFTKSVAL